MNAHKPFLPFLSIHRTIPILLLFLTMIHFQLPRNSPTMYKSLKYAEQEEAAGTVKSVDFISNSLAYYLYDIKQCIDRQEHQWDIYKRFTNPYEYIHTTIPGKRKSVSKYKPLSRSYFKMIELVRFFRLLDTTIVQGYGQGHKRTPFRSFHLAEGPGGFIEALAHMRSNPYDQYIGMTILDDNVHDTNIPGWKKSQSFLRDHPNVKVEVGADGTGDILSMANYDYCCVTYGSSMDMITGDGGFDFSLDFNNQERDMSKLLFGQIAYALSMQKLGGSFILKIFDCFMPHTMDMLALLSSFYSKVYITKPQTSRYANSEKYVVCKGFLHSTSHAFASILRQTMVDMLTHDRVSTVNVCRFLSVPLSMTFVLRMEEYNAIFGQQQIENIHYTLSLMENKNRDEKIDGLIKTNVQRSVNWCIKYNVPYQAGVVEPFLRK